MIDGRLDGLCGDAVCRERSGGFTGAAAPPILASMAILDIALMGNPILAQQAALVDDPLDPAIAALVADMEETMAAANGVGLAAPQVKRSLQLVVFKVPAERTEDGVGLPFSVLINPVIEPLGEAIDEAYEGCLSVPGLTGRVPRWRQIGYRGIGLDGKAIEREVSGFHARVIQHECDHLWGRLYPSRMRDLGSLAFVDELYRQVQASRDDSRDVEASATAEEEE
ncbi:peptide deformylase [Telmatospirillum sp.]|uniref:peptide deformylase n=1 Tax=Telmatospirillum sp. TaxID=2079197 RepID=UPI00283BAB87|nr:peptide deformylase [Telmatospirillum sp.]MDR3439509.1 peptide deformylase [Telmatospirillum sp.]